MPKKNDSWGIEVGANAIKAVRLVRDGVDVTLADFELLPFKTILTTPDLNVDEAIQVNLDQFVQRHDISDSTVVLSVAGHMAFARFAKLPPVDPKKIPDIVKFEAVQQIPFPIDQVEWDYQVFTQPDSPDVEVGIFAIMKDRVMKFLNNYRTLGISIDGLTLSPLAVYNAMTYDMELTNKSPGTILMDIGTTSTDVVVAEDGHIWLRTLPIGGNNFTEALVRSFKLGFPKAEKLKREAATSKYARQIYVAMRPVFADLVQEVQRSLGYYQSLNRDANLTQLVGLGSTFRLPGLRKFLKQQLQLEVIRPDGFKRLSVAGKRASELSSHALNLATAYGLALQGLGVEQVSANILPKHILKQRMWHAKQSWIAAAAALMIVATGAAGFRQWSDRGAVRANFDASQPHVRLAVDRAERLVKQWNKIEVKDSRQANANLQRIPDYREVWAKLLVDINGVMNNLEPQSDLLASNYEAIKQIPRAKRRGIHIQEITSDYQFSYYGLGGGTSSPTSDSMDEDEPQSMDPWKAVEDRMLDDDDSDLDDMGVAPISQLPSFLVTITGTISQEDGREQLARALAKWLARNAARPDRPYKIIPVDSADGVVYIERIGLGSNRGDQRRRPTRMTTMQRRPRSSRRPSRNSPLGGPAMLGGPDFGPAGFADPALLAGPGGRPGGRPGGYRPMPSPYEPRRSSPRRETSSQPLRGAVSLEGLLPMHPLAEEPRDKDWEFELRWRVELVKPEDTRAPIQARGPGLDPGNATTGSASSREGRT